MSKETQIEKQIEEMARAMCGNGMPNGNCAIYDEPCGEQGRTNENRGGL